MSGAEVTAREWVVLAGIHGSQSAGYQPSEELLATANRLISRGLAEQAADFPAVLVLTDEGNAAYWTESDRRDAIREARGLPLR
jgi:hypothetical protein